MENTKFANHYGYSDIYPYEIVNHVSEKCIEVRILDAKLSPDFKPEFVAGGFCAHCTNQQDQTYTYTKNMDAPIVRIRKHKNGEWYGKHKHKQLFVLSDKPRKYHDYNF